VRPAIRHTQSASIPDDRQDVIAFAMRAELALDDSPRRESHFAGEPVDLRGDMLQQARMAAILTKRRFVFAERHQLLPLAIEGGDAGHPRNCT
jgi:hypothetical protein